MLSICVAVGSGHSLSSSVPITKQEITDAAPTANMPTIFIRTPDSTVVKGIQLKFSRVSETVWSVYASSLRTDEQLGNTSRFYGPVAVVEPDNQLASAHFSSFVPVEASTDRKGEVVVSFGGISGDEAPTSLVVNVTDAGFQDCPVFGKEIVSRADAKKPQNRFRIVTDEGEDITDKVSISTGGFPILKSQVGIDESVTPEQFEGN